MMETKALAEALPEEIARVTKILGRYNEIGPAGAPGALMVRTSLDLATRALARGDVTAMILAYADLKEYTQ